MDARIRGAIAELGRFVINTPDALALPREAAEFVHALVTATGARSALEIGTSYGYSALWIAAALRRTGGRLSTVDQELRKSNAARDNLLAAGVAEVVDLYTGPAIEVLPKLLGPFDFVLNDADKRNCIGYVELLDGKLAQRAVILTDNTLTHPEELSEFLQWIRGHPRFVSAHVPIGNGMEMSVYRSDGALSPAAADS